MPFFLRLVKRPASSVSAVSVERVFIIRPVRDVLHTFPFSHQALVGVLRKCLRFTKHLHRVLIAHNRRCEFVNLPIHENARDRRLRFFVTSAKEPAPYFFRDCEVGCRSVSVVFQERVSSAFQQEFHRGRSAFLRGVMQRRAQVVVSRVDRGALFQQNLHHRQVPKRCRFVQRCVEASVDRNDVGAVIEQQ